MLSINDLHKQYGEVTALNGCSFTVARGRMLGFLGPNGAGKTTAMRSIFGLIRPDRGDVTWDGQPVGAEQLSVFGYMPEQRGLYPKMKARDQIAYFGQLNGMGATDARRSAEAWLDRFGLSDRYDEATENLSHGNQQRVQLATSLVHDPDLLVLDEPFGGLDPLAVTTMSEVLREQAAAGKAVVFSSHQLDLVEDLCEDVAIINQGSVVMTGSVSELKDAAPIRHLELEIEADSGGDLIAELEGVRSVRSHNGRLTAIIDAETDIRGFIGRAQEAGRVRHFAYTTPSLSDLFKAAVE